MTGGAFLTRWFQKLRPLAPNLLLNGRSKTFHFALYPCQERLAVPNNQKSAERDSQAPAGVQGIEECAHLREVVHTTVFVPHGNAELIHIAHRIGLKEVLEELVFSFVQVPDERLSSFRNKDFLMSRSISNTHNFL